MKKSYCYNCEIETNCEKLYDTDELLPSEIYLRNEDGTKIDHLYRIVYKKYTIFKCCGCERIHIEIKTKVDKEQEDNKVIPAKTDVGVSEFLFHLQLDYIGIYREVLGAINQGYYNLACCGIRTMIDIFMNDKVGNNGTFSNRLNKMKDEHFISCDQYNMLKILIEAGNASAHRGFVPEQEDVINLLGVLDIILKTEVDSIALNALKEKIPHRK